MNDAFATIREFRTREFRVIVDALPEDMPVDVDDDGETAAKVDSGEMVHFIARCRVLHDTFGEVGSDYLGGCIYADVDEFQDHRRCGAENRRRAAQGAVGRCGSYFAEMIREACREARERIIAMRAVRVRGANGDKAEDWRGYTTAVARAALAKAGAL